MNTAVLAHLPITYGCSRATAATGDSGFGCKAENVYRLALYRKKCSQPCQSPHMLSAPGNAHTGTYFCTHIFVSRIFSNKPDHEHIEPEMTGQKCVPLPYTVRELQHPHAHCSLRLPSIFLLVSRRLFKPVSSTPTPFRRLATFSIYPLEGGQALSMKESRHHSPSSMERDQFPSCGDAGMRPYPESTFCRGGRPRKDKLSLTLTHSNQTLPGDRAHVKCYRLAELRIH